MNNIQVSIITPTYNSEKYLEETILSVVNQTYNNIQYIIIDGGSTDNTLNIIEKYKDKIDIFISERDNGMYDAINKGLKMATGQLVAYINSDDLYNDENVLSNIVDFFEENKDIDWAYSDFYSINEKNEIISKHKVPKVNYKEFIASDWSYIPQPTSIWRRKIIDEGVRFDCKYRMASDYKFFLTLVRDYNVKKTTFNIAKFRIHEESLSSKQRDLNNKEMRAIKSEVGYKKKNDIFKYTFYIKYKIKNIKNYLKRFIKC